MKKLFYSLPVKAAVFIMCVAIAASAAGQALYALCNIDRGYYFDGGSFDESYKVVNMLYHGKSELEFMLENSSDGAVSFTDLKNLDYYGKNFDTGKIISNMSDAGKNYFEEPEFEELDEFGNIYYIKYVDGDNFYETGNYRLFDYNYTDGNYGIYIKINDETAADMEADWRYSESLVKGVLESIPLYGALLFIGIVYLSFAAGRKGDDDEIHMMSFDRIPIDFVLAATVGVWVAAFVLTLGVYYLGGIKIINADSCGALFGGIFMAANLWVYMSVLRNFKNHTFANRFLTVRIIRWCLKRCVSFVKFTFGLLFKTVPSKGKRVINGVCDSAKKIASAKMPVKVILGAVVTYTAAVVFLGIFVGLFFEYGETGLGFLFFIIILGLLIGTVFGVYKNLMGMDEVRAGLKRIRSGETTYKIPECKSVYAASMAQDINAIGEGIQNAVERSVKSERMKSELITNVSHDLKTPLTAIINYTDLLMKETLSPDEANDYVRIIDKKSKKLRQLTSDLFDISKVRSGNEEIEREGIDYKLLISQAVAELDRDIREAELEFIIKLPDEDVQITTDGKKLSRVYENLIINAVKYSLKGTRVYIELYKTCEGYITEIKNIAGYKMDFEDDEITERFVRGDKSRQGDGSGLGLAIAKSYVELLGGKFAVKTDGDLFKAIIELNSLV